jgi:hypothetical protein
MGLPNPTIEIMDLRFASDSGTHRDNGTSVEGLKPLSPCNCFTHLLGASFQDNIWPEFNLQLPSDDRRESVRCAQDKI